MTGPLIAVYTATTPGTWEGRQLSPGQPFTVSSREVAAAINAGWPLYTIAGALVVKARSLTQPTTINPKQALPLPKGARP